MSARGIRCSHPTPSMSDSRRLGLRSSYPLGPPLSRPHLINRQGLHSRPPKSFAQRDTAIAPVTCRSCCGPGLAHTDIGNTAGTIRTHRGWLPDPTPPCPESEGDEDGCWSRKRRTNRRHHGCAAITVTSVQRGCLISGDGALPPGLFRGDLVVVVELHTTASTTVAIPTIRVVAADLAGRADFDLDSIADLRMAIDDACAVLVRLAAPGATLRCRLTVWPERIEMAAEVDQV